MAIEALSAARASANFGGRWSKQLPLIAGVATAVLSAPTIGARDLWMDEALTVASGNQLFQSLAQRSGSMATYYILMSGWSKVSLDPAWLRLPSLIFAAVAVALACHLTLRHWGERAALWSGLFLVPAWGVTRYAQEVRAYSLAMALACLSWVLLFQLERSEPRQRLWGYVNALLVYSHPLGGLVIVAQVAALLDHRRALRSDILRRSGGGLAITAIFLVPMAATLAAGSGAAPDWVPPLTWASLRDGLAIFVGPVLPIQLLAASALLIVAVRLFRPAGDPISSWRQRSIVYWLVVPPSGLILLSLQQPMFLGRYLIPVLPAMAIAVGLAISRLDRIRLEVAIAATVVALLVPGQIAVHTDPGHRWTDAIEYLDDEVHDDEATGLSFLGASRTPFELNAVGHPLLRRTRAVSPPEPWGELRRYPEPMTLADMASRVMDLDVLWVVVHVAVQPMEMDLAGLERLGFCLEKTVTFGPKVEINRFGRISPPAETCDGSALGAGG